MIYVKNETIYEYEKDDITPIYYYVRDCDIIKRPRGNQRTKNSHFYYKDIVATFDIETSRFSEKNAPRADLINQSFCYIWQMSLNNDYVIVGRTLASALDFLTQLDKNLMRDERLVIYVHNLSYEFQFLSGIVRFKTEDVFCIKKRKILKATLWDTFEFRCSYLHSNMGLALYTEKMQVEHAKLDGLIFDYNKIRYPWTTLTDYEILYSVYDVMGMVECIKKEMEMDGDTLYTLPLTSTGYVRRDAKESLKKLGKKYLKNMEIDYHIYELLKESFRGGDTHANRYFSGKIIENVHSADRSSSYPDVLINGQFPMSQFAPLEKPDTEKVIKYLNVYKRALLMRVRFKNVCLRRLEHGCPYLTKDKSRRLKNATFDNGRILECDEMETTLTDIDFKIVLKEYDIECMEFDEVYHARYGDLPEELKEVVRTYYVRKTELKDIDGKEVLYTKEKNKLNACYGMMAQDVVKIAILFNDEYEKLYAEDQSDNKEANFEKNNRKRFLSYAWGVWCTALARHALHAAIWIVEDTPDAYFLYCDTDSVKYIGEVDLTPFNKKAMLDSKKNKAFATDKHGVTHYMGVYEQEADMIRFKTMGAKKYAYEIVNKKGKKELHLTLAGVSKKDGAEYLAAHGGLESFCDGFTFPEGGGGGNEAVYNDRTNTFINIDGHTLHISRNVCIKESTYTLGLTPEYSELLDGYKEYNVLTF